MTTGDPSAVSRYPDLAGQVAVVTGGAPGIGAATVRALAANGVAVAAVGRDRSALEALTDELTFDGGRVIGVAADCTGEEEVDRLHTTVAERLGAVDILLPFAGGNGMPVPTAQETAAHWRTVIEGDLTSTFLAIAAFLPDMIDRN